MKAVGISASAFDPVRGCIGMEQQFAGGLGIIAVNRYAQARSLVNTVIANAYGLVDSLENPGQE
ncbi:hypothetical protein ACXYTJ_16675 [Gilvimarinus sp. F26214L]|uniref:hypothetical protein n=1 Tax=Gilvimarinus sp. DZF01 TaxID=3461371 RepID=UPI00404614AA